MASTFSSCVKRDVIGELGSKRKTMMPQTMVTMPKIRNMICKPF